MNETEQRVNRPKCRFLVLIRKRDHLTNEVGLTDYLEKSKAIPHSMVPPIFGYQYKLQIKDICEKKTQSKVMLNYI